MRRASLLASLLCLALVPRASADEPFNPYAAILAGRTLAEIEPLIPRQFGEIDARDQMAGIFSPGHAIDGLVLRAKPKLGILPTYFFFCGETLAGFSGQLSPEMAEAVLASAGLAMPDDADLLQAGTYKTIALPERDGALIVENGGTDRAKLNFVMPLTIVQTFDFAALCEEEPPA